MRFLRIRLENWRNFLEADLSLQRRVFLVGPNASGKSNFLDAVRFLRDVAEQQGGFQRAVAKRSGLSQIRSLHARRQSGVVIDAGMDLGNGEPWRYRLEFTQREKRRPVVAKETVWHGEQLVLSRPDAQDKADPSRLTQTHLEQVNANRDFRRIADFLSEVRYLHLVPQLVREPERSARKARDPYGSDFLEQLAATPKRTHESRLRRIRDALRIAVPNLKNLVLEHDERGVPHLGGLYQHWRPNAGWQTEGQFSDGTLRLLGLLWVLLDGNAPLLLEEPELSLHAGVVGCLVPMMARLLGETGRQVVISTHSAEFLADEGIAPEEVLMFLPEETGTRLQLAAQDEQVRALVAGGLRTGEAVLPRTAPKNAERLILFGCRR